MSDTLMVSVSGMRGIVGSDLTPELVSRYAAALGAWTARRRDGATAGPTRVVLGRDARTSGEMFARAATAGLQSVGVEVIDVGVAPTPTVQMAVEYHHAGAGLILTASHNPIEWNALKFVGPDGIFLDAESGAAVRAMAEDPKGPPRAGWDRIGPVRQDRDAISRHLDLILDLPGDAEVHPHRHETAGVLLGAITIERDGQRTQVLPRLLHDMDDVHRHAAHHGIRQRLGRRNEVLLGAFHLDPGAPRAVGEAEATLPVERERHFRHAYTLPRTKLKPIS